LATRLSKFPTANGRTALDDSLIVWARLRPALTTRTAFRSFSWVARPAS
jgi:hypothetical protein